MRKDILYPKCNHCIVLKIPKNTISEKDLEDSQPENARNDRYIVKYYSSNLTRSEIIMHYQEYAKNNYWCCFKELADKPHTDYGWGEKYTVYQWRQYSNDLRLMMFNKEQESPQKLNHYMLGFFW